MEVEAYAFFENCRGPKLSLPPVLILSSCSKGWALQKIAI